MSRYKPYTEYRDSGIERLGSVPTHWKVKKLKWLASLQSGNFITSETIEAEGEYCVFGGNGLRGYTNAFTHEGRYVLIGRQGALCGNINYAEGKFWASEHAVVVSPQELVNVTWLGEMLRSMQLNQYSVAAAQPGLAVERIIDLHLQIPPPDEQDMICKFLDRETARVDRLVNKKAHFIDLLREKRQALITQAVSEGLNPEVPRKDSGAEWLGDVPAHWNVTRVKYVIDSMGQGWSPECESRAVDDGEWGVLKVGCVNGGVFRPTENKALPMALTPRPELALKKGDILVSRANTRELVGGCTVIDRDFPRLMICDKLYRLIVDEAIATPAFLAALISVHGRREVELEATGASASMVNIAQSVILNLQIGLPPLDEQNAIISTIASGTQRYDTLISKTESSIELLRERRSALITAAVTGQIDLRQAE